METIDYQRMHAQLLDMLGAKDHEDAVRIIAKHHALEIASQPAERGEAAAEVVIGAARCYSDDEWYREVTAAGICFLAPLDQQDAAISLIGRGIKPRSAPPPAAGVPDDAEAVSACLGDDAAAMLEANPEDERALNMQRAAQIIEAMLSAAPEADHG